MTDDEKEWLHNLQAGDKVHLCNRNTHLQLPFAMGLVVDVEQHNVRVQINNEAPHVLSFLKATGQEHNPRYDPQVVVPLYIRPYSHEAERERRARNELAKTVHKLSGVTARQWKSLPVEVLDDICAILRENEVNV